MCFMWKIILIDFFRVMPQEKFYKTKLSPAVVEGSGWGSRIPFLVPKSLSYQSSYSFEVEFKHTRDTEPLRKLNFRSDGHNRWRWLLYPQYSKLLAMSPSPRNIMRAIKDNIKFLPWINKYIGIRRASEYDKWLLGNLN